MSRSMVVKHLILTWENFKLSVLSAMEYRTSFIFQVVGMVLNDLGFMVIWFIFFQKFPSINGWELADTITLFSIATISYSFISFFFWGAHFLAGYITRGELDYFLAYPTNTLWHVITSKVQISGIGDLFAGIILYFIFANRGPMVFLLLLAVSVLSGLIWLNFVIIVNSLAFFFGNFERSSEQIVSSVVIASSYPQNIFHGGLKFLFMTIVPAYFIYTLPVRLVRSFDLDTLLILLAYWLASTLLAVVFFQKGLKSYESGNLLNVKL